MHSQLALTEHASLNLAQLILLDSVRQDHFEPLALRFLGLLSGANLGERYMQDCGQEGWGRRRDCEESPVVGNLGELQSPVGPRREHLPPRRQRSSLLPRIVPGLADVKLLFLR